MSGDIAPAPEAPKPPLFARSALGWTCVGMAILLILLFAYALFAVLPLMTQPPGFVDRYMEKAGSMDASFLSALEYESFVIRTQGIQIALGFIVGLLIAAFGLVLFAVGATDAFGAGMSSHEGIKVNLRSTAPGLIVLLISGAIISFAVTKDVRRKFDASFEEGKKPQIISEGMHYPPKSNQGEDASGKGKH